ncbi:MAG: hypothetical protein RSE41_00045 [Clostridia bacterium]
MKNIKNNIFDYTDVEYVNYITFPFKQGIRKKIQRGLKKDSTKIAKDWRRRNNDKSPWYYAGILHKHAKDKTVDECLNKFRKRFNDSYALKAFYTYFNEQHPYNNYYIEDGIVRKTICLRKPLEYDESNYEEKYWDKTNLNYVAKEVFYNYEKIKHRFQIYLRDLYKYNKNINESITCINGRKVYKPIFDFHTYNILIAKYPLGFEKITIGEKIPISHKSKIYVKAQKDKKRSIYLNKHSNNIDWVEILKKANKTKKKEKRKKKENKSYYYSKNHSLYIDMNTLKTMNNYDKEWDYLLRIYDEK